MKNVNKEQLVKAAQVAEAQPTSFWKEVGQRMDIRDKAKTAKVQPRRVKE
jgi:hypothetical protein